MDYKKLTKRAAYVSGLAEGMNIETESNTGKLVKKLLEIVEDMCWWKAMTPWLTR